MPRAPIALKAWAHTPAKAGHYWAGKNGDQNRSGFSLHDAPFDLSKPTWTYKVPLAYHNSPVIDGEGNVYLAHYRLGVVALDRQGRERWRFPLKSSGNPVLLGGEIFVCSQTGVAHAIDLATGKERWQSKIANNCPGDAWSASAAGQTVIMLANVEREVPDGNCDIVALNATDGSQIWRFPLCGKGHPKGYNGMPSIVGNAVLFQDTYGGVHRLSLASGAAEWSAPPYDSTPAGSTGGMATGPNGLIYGASNYDGYPDRAKGLLQALDLRTGAVRWRRTFEQGLNSGPAVGRLGPNGRLAVIAQVGDNFLEFGLPASVRMSLSGRRGPVHKGTVLAIDAESGKTIWSFDVDSYQSWTYPQQALGCLPDAFGNPAIGGDGTVYVNWSGGGYAYAVRDADGDGAISAQEVSKVRTNSGMNGETALAPGLAVVPSCDALRGYVA